MNIDRYHFIAESEVLTSKFPMLYNYTNSWWCVHPEKGLAFFDKGYGHPQCNRSKEIAERFKPEWAEIKYFERVLAPLNLSDYRE